MLSGTKLPSRAARSSSSFQLPHRPQGTPLPNHAPQHRLAPAAAVPVSSSNGDVDVVVVGAGIIGLLVTRQLLLQHSDLSVALFDAKQPCAGATGAGVLGGSVGTLLGAAPSAPRNPHT